MREQKTITVDGDDFLLTQFPTEEGLEYQKEIAKIIVPIIAEITRSGDTEQNAIGIALSKLSEKIDQIDIKMIRRMVERGSSKGNFAVKFDEEFAGKYLKLYKLVQEIIKFNFEDVFTLVGSSLE